MMAYQRRQKAAREPDVQALRAELEVSRRWEEKLARALHVKVTRLLE